MCARTYCSWRCLLLFLSYFVYLLIGAAVFQALELKEESELKARVWRKKAQFLNSSSPSAAREALEKLVEAITEAVKHGVNPVGNDPTSSHSNWDFSSSFFFAVTVVSTIGYGNISPTTPGGQIFCVFYALFGIPLHVIILTRVGKNLTSHTEKLRMYLSKKGMKERRVKILTFLFFLVIGTVIFLALPPFVFCLFENWSYREGIYYAFITLSTIGFGDYVVGVDPHRKFHKFYRTSVAIWILFGIAWLALLFNLLSTFMEDTEKKIAEINKKKKAAKEKMNFKYDVNTNLSSENVSILCSETGVMEGAQETFEQQELSQVDLKIIASDHDQKETKLESLNAKISDQETSSNVICPTVTNPPQTCLSREKISQDDQQMLVSNI